MKRIIPALLTLLAIFAATARETYNFNRGWTLAVGDYAGSETSDYDDSAWKRVTLPRAFNQEEAFRLRIDDLTDTVAWYRKHFYLPPHAAGKKIFVEFEGVRQGADVYLNGHHLGLHENGVMAFGFDLTPYINFEGENVMAVRTDNDWHYRERSSATEYQWNNTNFNANYGGIPKNVYLHITDPVYQTLPLYSTLGTTGIYVYATDIDLPSRSATVNVEADVKNDTSLPVEAALLVSLTDAGGNEVARFSGSAATIAPGSAASLEASSRVDSLRFWHHGYGYLYDVTSQLIIGSDTIDTTVTRTGFRKTRFDEGKVWINDCVTQLKGYAQRTSNEWPGTGMSVAPWLSDYSNSLMVESGANIVRWMHVAPWRQDVESCDRIGLMQAMPAGDAEKDADGRRWEQRVELMRDAIIYYRNNPSIIFYECGNKGITERHMAEMKSLRDTYDPHGGRAIGSREMLDSHEAEYGGEMLYINKSARNPLWAMEYCRDEGLRKYWDAYSYPFHAEGDGPFYRDAPAREYNHNQDEMAVELVRRWYDYYRERPGSGNRVSSGGVKIIFSDTNTHFRGAENYRRSGVTDAMRIPKDGFFAHRVMWGGDVDSDEPRIHIAGHWNYPDSTVKPVYVISNSPSVELRINGSTVARLDSADYGFLFTFPDIKFIAGTLEAIGLDRNGSEESRHILRTASEAASLILTAITAPNGMKADGADMALLQFETVDSAGIRCPLDNRAVSFVTTGPSEWIGGIAQGPDNYIGSTTLPVECGINRALIRSTETPGTVTITATAEGLPPASITLPTQEAGQTGGLSEILPSAGLGGRISTEPDYGSSTYTDRLTTLPIASVKAGCAENDAALSIDDNEVTSWQSDGNLRNAWITYTLTSPAMASEVSMKLSGWRRRSYPIEIYADDRLLVKTETPKSLGYVHIPLPRHSPAGSYTVMLAGSASLNDAFGHISELEAANNTDSSTAAPEGKHTLGIVEIEFLTETAEN
ncbi:MAG: glycoside hydrolase family 2 protein [Barnesiella sp.]|nr:glycoside hydrolase family 2 protein [Barnesiella sp.]